MWAGYAQHVPVERDFVEMPLVFVDYYWPHRFVHLLC